MPVTSTISRHGPRLTREQAALYVEKINRRDRAILGYRTPRAWRIMLALQAENGDIRLPYLKRGSYSITGGHRDTLPNLRHDLPYFCRNGTVCKQIVPPDYNEGWRAILYRVPMDPACMI